MSLETTPRQAASGSPRAEKTQGRLAALPPAPPTLPGVDLNAPEQLRLLRHLKRFMGEHNPVYSSGDAHVVDCMIRYLSPRRIVGIGFGGSTPVILDTLERHRGNDIHCTLIGQPPEPFQEVRHQGRLSVLSEPAHAAPASVFESLGSRDIVFVEPAHHTSDVNHVIFEVLPVLASDVHVYFSETFCPAPSAPAASGQPLRSRSEAYLLRAFLQHNAEFEIMLFCDYLKRYHCEAVDHSFPALLLGDPSSIWMRRREHSMADAAGYEWHVTTSLAVPEAGDTLPVAVEAERPPS